MSDIVAFRFRLTGEGGPYAVTLTCDGFEPAHGTFEANTREGHLATVVSYIHANRAGDEHLKYAGSALWASLVAGEVGVRYEEIVNATRARSPFYHVRLSLPGDLRALPWETLYDERRVGFLAAADNFCIVHDPPEGIEVAPSAERPAGPVRVLVAIPEGSGLDVGREWRNLTSEVDRLARDMVVLERVQGRVTADALGEELEKGWDIFHFIGHGGLDDQERVTLRLNRPGPDQGDVWLDAETFGLLFRARPPRLVVLNSCLGAAQSAGSLSGAAPFLLRAGVPAVVAMRYEIYDPDALTFTPAFYRELLIESGRIDRALQRARLLIKLKPHDESKRGFITPVLYLVAGHEQLHEPARAARAVRVTPAVPPPAPSVELPRQLVAALAEGRVVPVVGPGVLRAGVRRGNAVVPAAAGPRELADILRERFEYPDAVDFEASDRATWTADWLLQRVCQHCAFVHGGIFKIVEAIEDTYRSVTPPSAFAQLASWKVPGMVYTFFDGLLARAIQDANRAFQVINSLSDQVQADEQHPLLVHLRGTISDTSSLVLTEREHEELAARMDRLSGAVAGLATRRPGRSILFVGVNPRDDILRRFVRVLMGDETRRRLQGPSYFASATHSPVDDAYWSQYGVQWIQASLVDFIEAATKHATGGVR